MFSFVGILKDTSLKVSSDILTRDNIRQFQLDNHSVTTTFCNTFYHATYRSNVTCLQFDSNSCLLSFGFKLVQDDFQLDFAKKADRADCFEVLTEL